MKEIKLNNGMSALVDDENYEWLSIYNWEAILYEGSYYAVRHEGKNMLYMHHYFGCRCEHYGQNTLDNRRENLYIPASFIKTKKLPTRLDKIEDIAEKERFYSVKKLSRADWERAGFPDGRWEGIVRGEVIGYFKRKNTANIAVARKIVV